MSEPDADRWDRFAAFLTARRVPARRIPYWVRWGQQFERFHPGHPPAARSEREIQAFLSHLSRQPRIQAWQVEQAPMSLIAFYHLEGVKR